MSAQTAIDGPAGLHALVGSPLGSSAWMTIEQPDVDSFAAVTRDEQWIHVDPERAAAGPFGSTIAHGYLTLSLCSHFLEQIFRVDGAAMAVNYGLNRVRFPAPVPVGARVRGNATLAAAKDVGGGAVEAAVAVEVEVEGAPKPACVAEAVIRFYP
ncbi:MAG: MaoC family dehydratase [Solirubrobacterales bacterium]|nr:MaoC family dehydratase [Solirubrobacterales bacterium]